MPSSVVRAMHYDAAAKILRIIFVSGLVYDYLNVPAKVYREMMASASKGEFLNRRIKEKFPFKKVE